MNVGPDGNLYVVGSFSGTADFDPGAASVLRTASDAQDGFVAKYTPARDLVWVKTFGGSGGAGLDYGTDIGFDAVGNAYIVGTFGAASAQFGSTTLTNNGRYDAYVAKLDTATGTFAWARGAGGSNLSLADMAFGVAVTPTGEAYVTGRFLDTVDFDPAAGSTHNLTAAGEADAYVWKLNSQGDFLWVRQFGSPGLENGHRVVRGQDGNIYVAGTFRDTVDFGSPSNPIPLTGTPGVANTYFAKLDEATGDTIWARQISGSGAATADYLVADGAGSLYLAGRFVDTVNFGSGTPTLVSAGGEDAYVSRWDTAGNLTWATQVVTGPGNVTPGTLRLDATGNLLQVFGFEGTADFDPGPDAANLTSVDQFDGALLQLRPDGSFGSVRQISGPGITQPQGLATDSAGNIYVSGRFQNSVTPSTGDVITSTGAIDTFVVKIAPIAPTKFFVVEAAGAKTNEYDILGNRQDVTSLVTGNANPRGAVSIAAGNRVWVIDANKKVYVYDDAGTNLGSWTANGLTSPQGVATNGTDIWIVDSSTDRVYKYTGAATRLSGSQNAASDFKLNNQNGNSTDLVTNGTNVWVVDSAATDKVFKYSMSGTLVGSWTIDSRNTSPTGITLDPSSPSTLWIVDNAADQVFAYAGATSRNSGSQSATIAVNLGTGNTDPQGIADPPPTISVVRDSNLATGQSTIRTATAINSAVTRLEDVFATLSIKMTPANKNQALVARDQMFETFVPNQYSAPQQRASHQESGSLEFDIPRFEDFTSEEHMTSELALDAAFASAL